MTIGKRNQYFFLLVFILIGLTVYLFNIREEEGKWPEMRLLKANENDIRKKFLVYTPGCKIPEMDPYDVSVRKHIKPTYFPECSKTPPLVESNETSIWVVTEVFKSYNISDLSDLNCCYEELRRQKYSNNMDVDSTIVMSNNCIPFNHSAHIPFEFIKVECRDKSDLIYQDYHGFIVPKPKSGNSEEESSSEPDVEGLSVLIVGADSVSRLNLHRIMPRTMNFMRYIGAIEFFGYNKVQDNTFPNLVAILSGYMVEELEFCWPQKASFFDDCPWIWKNYTSKNYLTAFAEDAAWMGIFHYFKNGFKVPPTDYYARPFIHTAEKIIGSHKIYSSSLCTGHRYASELLFNYAYKFISIMSSTNKKFWGLFWESSLTHDVVNVPSVNDDIFYNFFERIEKLNIFNNTAVFFISDHGMRWGSIRSTYQGRMEEHLPFLFVILPEWFKDKYSSAVKNLQQNTHLLTTPFDVHETLKDFLTPDALQPENLKARELEAANKRGSSLFLSGSVDRTCMSVGIKPTWCTCQRKKPISIHNSIVIKAADAGVKHLNFLLKDFKNCAKLQLTGIESAYVESEDDLVKPNESTYYISDYVVVFITTPGWGKFEAVVRHRSNSNKLTVMGDISRINLYSNQSKCVSNYYIKLYCYCIGSK